MITRRVVVTGMGIVCPVGNSLQEAWNNLSAGKSGIDSITICDVSGLTTKFAGEVKGFDPLDWLDDAKAVKKFDRYILLAMAATNQALIDSGLDDNAKTNAGVSIGSGIGGLEYIQNNCASLFNKGPRRVSPYFIPGSIVNMAAGCVSIEHRMSGPNITVATACTTATHSIGLAARMIAYGDADVFVAGGSEAPITRLGIAGFNAARALSTRNDDPQRASRPWDRDRDGFVLGEGSGIMVLEEYQHALNRGAKIYAELEGFGMSGDAHHITLPPETGEGASKCMQRAIEDAGVATENIDYINAHGTSTQSGDLVETIAIRSSFGDHADHLAVSSTKSMTGHLLGASGAIEAIFSVMALENQLLPPTINLDNPEEGCDLDYVRGQARQASVKRVMSNSFGFGGTNGSLVFAQI